MIIITGAAGFIGSCMVAALNEAGYRDLVLVDDFVSYPAKARNLEGKTFTAKVERDAFFPWLEANAPLVQAIIHLGARTDTTEQSVPLFDRLNLHYSQWLWQACVRHGLPLIYASSAATYGDGALGFDDDVRGIPHLQPLNPYGWSKQQFDVWALAQEQKPFFWAGLKFFNVYGPNEYHKGRMASVIMHAYRQISATGGLKLFRSHRPDYTDGGQMRDFVYVKDLTRLILWLMEQRPASGIYNAGSGQARPFNDLAAATFAAMGAPLNINYIDTPEDIRNAYQYFTEANMGSVRRLGYETPFTSLEDGVADYVKNYLIPDKTW